MNISLQLTFEEQKMAEENVLRLVEEHKRQKAEEALNKILQLEMQLKTKQTLEMGDSRAERQTTSHETLVDDYAETVKHKMKEMNDEVEDKLTKLEELIR